MSTDTRTAADLAPVIESLDAVEGEVVTPDHPDYDSIRQVVPGDIDRRPAAIVRAASAVDVARVVRLVGETGVPLAVRAGGHSGAGHGAVEGGIVLDLRDLDAFEIDPQERIASAGGGLTAGAYTAAAAQHGLATGFGDTGSVGIGGLATGGGVGFLSRKHGLTIDSLVSAQVVTADGSIVEVSEHSHPDLFWAIRGGGGNFGVVTRFTFRLHDVSEFTGGLLVLPATPEVVAGFVREALAAPEELSTIANVMPCPPLPFVPDSAHGQMVVFAFVAYAGPPADAEQAVGRLRSLAAPLADMVQPGSYASMFQPEPPDYHPTAVARTLYLDHVDEASAAAIIEQLESSDAPMRAVQLRPLGGAISRVASGATAYAHREAPIMANVASFYQGSGDRAAREAWVAGLVAALDQGIPGAYVNFLQAEGEERVRAAYPSATWDRLAAVKRVYDPHNLFRGNHNIPPAE